jgi:hypothetical protein
LFAKSSRYYKLPDRVVADEDGREILYRAVRLLPRPARATQTATKVGQHERLDLVAARTLGRPEIFWKLCDENRALDPFELIETARRLLWVPEG